MESAVLKLPPLRVMLIALFLLAPLTAAVAETKAAESTDGQLLDRIVAAVNDDAITLLELEDELAMIKSQLRAQQTRLPPDDVLRRQVLERMILRRIQLQMAERAHIRVDDDTLNRTIANIAGQNRLSLAQFRDALENEGMDYTRFRENMRNEIIINRLQKRQVNDRISVTPQEVDTFLANQALQTGAQYEYQLGHILISIPEAASAAQIEAASKKAEEVVAQLRAGADFAQTAVAVSDGRQALEGGNLDWRGASALPTLFADWVKGREPGEISGLIRSPSGFHIIKLLDRRSKDTQHLVTQTHVRHILVRIDEDISDEVAGRRIENLRQRLLGGADFAELARANSDDPGSAPKGGDLGWVNPDSMVPPFEKAMNALPVGKLSEPVKTSFGWHLIEVLARRQHDDTEAMRRNQASQAIQARKLEPAIQAWLRQLRDEAYVENRL